MHIHTAFNAKRERRGAASRNAKFGKRLKRIVSHSHCIQRERRGAASRNAKFGKRLKRIASHSHCIQRKRHGNAPCIAKIAKLIINPAPNAHTHCIQHETRKAWSRITQRGIRKAVKADRNSFTLNETQKSQSASLLLLSN